MKYFKAIVAMSQNRVIGAGNKIPWHLPEDFKWFKKMTMGNVVVMGAGEYSMRVWMDPEKLYSYGLVPDDVIKVIMQQSQESQTEAW